MECKKEKFQKSMEVIFKSIIYLCIIGLSLVSCKFNEQNLNPLELCSEFYSQNKELYFDGLLNVQILSIREYSEYDNKINKYNRIPIVIGINDSISGSNIKLPAFSRNADTEEQKLFFSRCDSSCIEYLKNKYNLGSNDDIFRFYAKEIESIYSNYYQIKVPEELPYTNIILIGCNTYIEFVLYKNEEKKINYRCYYVKDTIFSNSRIKEYFDGLPKFDDYWYYDLN